MSRLRLIIFWVVISVAILSGVYLLKKYVDNKTVIDASVMNNAELCDNADTSGYGGSSRYTLASGKIETPNLYYIISDDRVGDELAIVIDSSAREWSYHSGIEIKRVYEATEADVIVYATKIDNVGTVLARAYFSSSTFKRGKRLRPIILDEDDFLYKGKNILTNKYIVLLHEWGHIFNIRHSGINKAVLFPIYQPKLHHLTIDDILAIRDKYENHNDFYYNDKKYIWCSPKDNRNVAKNFKYKELVSNCTDVKNKGNFVCLNLITALQMIRNEYGAIKVNSTFRSELCNRSIKGAASQSAHQLSQAVDFTILNKKSFNRFRNDIANKRCIYYSLESLEVNGIGVYNHHIHIDVMDRNVKWITTNAGASSYSNGIVIED